MLLVVVWAAPAWADDPGLLLIYPGHARPNHVEVSGRLIEDEGFRKPSRNAGSLRNLWENAKRLESDEIEGALVEVTIAGRAFRVRTDDDGVWRISAAMDPPLAPGRLQIAARVLEDKGHPTPATAGAVFILPAGPSVAIISDFDDTVIHSEITSKRGLVRQALLRNASQSKAVKGAAAAYRAATATGMGAVFYLSGSPQNFMPRIMDFLELHRFPEGPILLKNFGHDPTFDQVGYKLGRIRAVFQAHPTTRFVLVGDSGEKDPEVYAQLRKEMPQRVAGIVIRRVAGDTSLPGRFNDMTVVANIDPVPALLTAARKP